MKILSNKKYNDLISKQFRGIFADVNDDNLLRENGLLYGENKELKQEIERLNNIINGMERFFQYAYDNEVRPLNDRKVSVWTICLDKLQELKGSDKE